MAVPAGISANFFSDLVKDSSDVTRFSYPIMRQLLTNSSFQTTWARGLVCERYGQCEPVFAAEQGPPFLGSTQVAVPPVAVLGQLLEEDIVVVLQCRRRL